MVKMKKAEVTNPTQKKNRFHRPIWKRLIKITLVLIILVVGAKFGFDYYIQSQAKQAMTETVIQTSKVETRDIQVVLSSSGTINPKNTYEVSTLIKGEVTDADFEEGDIVEEGQVLYQIATDDLDSEIASGETAVARAEKNYNKAVSSLEDANEDYQDAVAELNEAKIEYNDLDIYATATGIVKNVYIEVEDTVQKGSQVVEVYDNSYMLLEVPFLSTEIEDSMIGDSALIEVTDSFETLEGIVIEIEKNETVLSSNRIVKMVTIKVKNPGGLTTTNSATASIDEIYSSSEGTFSLLEETIITSKLSGEIAKLNVKIGDKIKIGDVIAVLSDETLTEKLETYEKAVENGEDAIDNAKESLESAEESLEDAKSDLQDILDSRTDYSVTAPITGQIIRKTALIGDTISNSTTLCVIYDLSSVVFQMYVDELDVMSVAVGQEVDVTADAFDNQSFSGVVTNISLESTTSGGVTQYPVTVRIDEVGDLLPGMNVTGEIIIEKVENVLAVTSDALQRGDVVYVLDETVLEAQGDIPAGFRAVSVETGLTDGDYIEIISGLTGEEEIYTSRNSTAITNTMMPGGSFDFNMNGAGGSFPSGGSSERPSGGNMSGGMGERP